MALLLFLAAPSHADDSVRAAELARVETLARAARSVVAIFDKPTREGGGSGVIIDPAGYGLTNFHVVASMLETRQGYGGLSDGKLYPLRVLGVDPGGDIAMFKLEGKESFDATPLADSDDVRVGQWVAALGNPFILAEDYTPTITLGIVSGVHRYQPGEGNMLEYADCIQVSTSINPGNSGGPLFDIQGRVIGINGRGSFEERGRVNVGLGYAVSMNQIRRFIPGLRAGLLVLHGTLGMTVNRAGNDLIVNAIQQDSPAAKAGVQLGDELLALNGRPIRTANEYNNAITPLPEAWQVTLRLRRDGHELEVTTRLERISIPMNEPFVPDLALNHAEARRMLQRYAATDRVAPFPPSAVLMGAANWLLAGNSAPALPLSIRRAPDGMVTIATNALADSRKIEVAPDAAAPLGGPATVWDSSVLWREWSLLVAPLVSPPELSVDWQVIGGDEAAGQIVSVLQRRLENGTLLRWKFVESSGALLAMTIGTRDNPEAVFWGLTDRLQSPGGQLQWPRRWSRQTSNETVLLDFTAMRIDAEAQSEGAP